MKTLIPPPIYMLLFATFMWLINHYIPLFIWIQYPWNKIGLGLIVLAALSDVSSLMQFVRSRTTVNPLSPNKTKQLVVNGLYHYSRNPMYLGMVVMLLGWGIYLGSLLTLFVIPFFVLVINKMQIEPEEAVLEEKFGDDYLNYKQQVRRWL